MKVELLAIVSNTDIACKSKNNLICLLMGCSKIVIEESKISMNGNTPFSFTINEKELPSKNKYYSILIETESDPPQDVIEQLSVLLHTLKNYFTSYKNSGISLYVIWSDISTYYAQKAYPIINSVENTLRTLILKLMLVSVGINWSDKNIPLDVRNKIINKKNDKNIFENVLWEMDFIQLSNVLFSNTRISDMTAFDNFIQTKNEGDSISVVDLDNFVSRNNWERYFSDKIDIDPEQLKANWKDLYDLRNKVAHNRDFLKSDYENVKQLAGNLIKNFQKAITEIEKGAIVLTPEQQMNVKGGIDATSLVIEALKSSQKWVDEQNRIHPNSFIGYRNFIKICENKGLDGDKVAEVLNVLEKNNLIEFYHHKRNEFDEFGVYSIKVDELA